MEKVLAATLAVALTTTPALAQRIEAPLVGQPTAAPGQAKLELPANTELTLSVNSDLSSKSVEEGQMFGLTLVDDVKLGDAVVIPRGTKGVGEVVWRTGKGAFGKSGKMNIELRHLDLNGRRIPIEGKYRQEGEGNTVATVAGVVAAGVFAAFITGKSALIPQGRELKARTTQALPVVLVAAPAAPQAVQRPVVVQAAAGTVQ